MSGIASALWRGSRRLSCKDSTSQNLNLLPREMIRAWLSGVKRRKFSIREASDPPLNRHLSAPVRPAPVRGKPAGCRHRRENTGAAPARSESVMVPRKGLAGDQKSPPGAAEGVATRSGRGQRPWPLGAAPPARPALGHRTCPNRLPRGRLAALDPATPSVGALRRPLGASAVRENGL
jgi:hypothetical protein